MESVVMENLFGGIYKGIKVLITGHTGFKGSWIALWLEKMGAELYGISLEPPTQPNHYDLLSLNIQSFTQDINDYNKLNTIIKNISPEIIFHLAAQPLVRQSYSEPLYTLETNIIGTANILESVKNLPDLKAVVVITSDKCYENKEWVWGYRENESMGGKDPYSASKGCAELITSAYRNSFFAESNGALICTARAGNVIGGGDWASGRIISDIVEAVSNSSKVFLRYPNATRPWQYVLEPLSGYLTLGWKLLKGEKDKADAWNFGPNMENNVTVLELVKEAQKTWDKILFDFDKNNNLSEAGFLMLDSSKAIKLLDWHPVWGFSKTVSYTMQWYKEFYQNNKVISEKILTDYITSAKELRLVWCRI